MVLRLQPQPQTLLQPNEHYLRIREEMSSGKCKCGRQWDLQLVASCIPKVSATTNDLSDNTSVHSHGGSSEYKMHKSVTELSMVDKNVASVQCPLLSVAHIIAISKHCSTCWWWPTRWLLRVVLCCWEPIDIPTNFLCSGDWQSPAVSCEGHHEPSPQSPLFSSLLHRHTLRGILTQFNFKLICFH